MRPADYIEQLELDALLALHDCTDSNRDDLWTWIQPVADFLGIEKDYARCILQQLRNKGFARFQSGLMTDEGEVAGAGYRITQAGIEHFNLKRGFGH